MTDTFDDCLACNLASGRIPLPGGLIHETGNWRVEHCVGPLGLGTLIVKPARHVTAVADLSGQEASELGPLLVLASGIVRELTAADQVYNCLWSHAGGTPVHLHYVIQGVTKEQMEHFGAAGPGLQMAMFTNGTTPGAEEIEETAAAARRLFAAQ
jgi:diadenosine tetraphosphate (Ap4A) HIT family hydrolase